MKVYLRNSSQQLVSLFSSRFQKMPKSQSSQTCKSDCLSAYSLSLCLFVFLSLCLCLSTSLSVSVCLSASIRRQYCLDKLSRLKRPRLGLGVLQCQKVGRWNLGNGLKLRGLLHLLPSTHSLCSIFNFLLLNDIFPIVGYAFLFINSFLFYRWFFYLIFYFSFKCLVIRITSSFQHQIILVTQITLRFSFCSYW